MDIQVKKGLLEYCVLAELKKEESYGYQIIKDISAYIEISESTLYPILRRLESENYVETYNVTHNNRIRRYYRITENGTQHLQSFIDGQEELLQVLRFIAGKEESDYE